MTTDRFGYTDYLLTHDYHELPEAIQQQISELDYRQAQVQAKRLFAQPTNEILPPALRQAYATIVASKEPQKTKSIMVGWWQMAAAVLLLLAGWGVGRYTAVPEEKLIYAVSSTPIPEPELIVRYDTIREVEYRSLVRYDTVRLEVAKSEPTPLLVYDTIQIYEEVPRQIPVAGSSSMEGRERLLDLLISAR
ncbi:MAG: hypothetical protein AAGF87_07390 [Bacteroidota bacterium]